ncbi:ABC multidrug transporter atrF [Pseudocercospora fuligena]|uniref:ABC multidrug transporter atrF n=1 Tax=Pseudocercospora fuligena TaxID=685502 RepID=A0A8H6VE81_9PEZI|nr:ABC multidrug transporter atrF [Pseudocercospora fuligena]
MPGEMDSVSTEEQATQCQSEDIEKHEETFTSVDWSAMPEVKTISQNHSEDSAAKRLGVTWRHLTIKGVGADASFNENVGSQFIPGKLKGGTCVATASTKTIIENSHGCVKPGEMLLVLGRPGAGCTSLLKVLANRRTGFSSVEGDVRYGSLSASEAAKYRGQIVMNTEDEIFFPTLTVGQTIDFATRLKVPYHPHPDYATKEEARMASKDFLLSLLDILHTANTRVGDTFIRGVSGGERKRVSILETMATRGSVYCWDNSTRGLDANTALQYVKAVRALSDIFGLASIVTLYQAGNGIYELFDKVLVLEKGKQIFYGPAKSARGFMEDLGFVCAEGANVADFLTGVIVPTERKIREGFDLRFPRTAEAIQSIYEASNIKRLMESEYDYPESSAAKKDTEAFERAVAYEKGPGWLSQRSPFTVGFAAQLNAAVKRQIQILMGDKTNVIVKQVSNVSITALLLPLIIPASANGSDFYIQIIQAFMVGSLFYNAPDDSSGLSSKSGLIFTAIMFNALVAQSEVTDAFTGRPVLAKHKSFALHHPATWVLSQIITDIPIILVQVSAFSLVAYFLGGLSMDAGMFFIFWFAILSTTFCMTALFRAVGAGFKSFDDAAKFSGVVVMAILLYIGYMIPKTDMGNWFVWIYWIDPLAYAYNALLSNEFDGKVIDCVGPNLVPSGVGYNSTANQACTGVRGALPGAASLAGTQYLDSLSYSHSNMWRNIGIVWVWWAFYVALTILFTMTHQTESDRKGVLLIPRENARTAVKNHNDEESLTTEKQQAIAGNSSEAPSDPSLEKNLIRNESTFTWRNLTYTVQTSEGPRVLLNNVHGWVKPGMLGALMGSSGAGKTTLLDVLAQRKTAGTIQGSVLVDGKPLPVSFQRSAAYCEQLDVHEALTTVREALEFSALLRQPRTISREEKLAYVDVILDLLEMHDIEDCLVGTPAGPGLTIEQRKRLTIGVELVSKPAILIFLDEPTSGLDGQAAFNTVRFLKKLAAAGQAVLVTVHQPSAQLFSEFDHLLLLAKGGNTVYFGDIGDNATTIREYFARNGAPCPPGKNPAEHMIDVVSDTKRDWSKIWLGSPEHTQMLQHLDEIALERSRYVTSTATIDQDYEFAMPLWDQIKIVTKRANKTLWRNTGYVNNKFQLHILVGLFTGFSYWQLGESVGELQLRMFALFNFIFVAPGVIAQLQPLFIEKRSIYDAREKKSKMYSWIAFVTGLIVSELPYLVICAVQFFLTCYYTVGLPTASNKAGAIFFDMLLYEFFYTGLGQLIAAYAPNAVAASLVNPLVIFTLAGYSGVLVPYSQIVSFWKYWLYYINPFNYLVGSMLVFAIFDQEVKCKESELAVFDPVGNQTCGKYLGPYLQGAGSGANLLNPAATKGCEVCQYKMGSDYLATLNLKDYYYGWRNAGIVVIFVLSSYGLVFLMMKLRTKKTKRAE